MAKTRVNKKRNPDTQSVNMINSQTATGSIKSKKKTITPVNDPIVQLFKPTENLTHEQIAERAYIIWQNRGCKLFEDEQNWNEAESQLKVEFGIS